MQRYYTTVEQSKELMRLGLNPETADMSWEKTAKDLAEEFCWQAFLGPNPAIQMNSFSFRNGYVLPCWSVGALLDVLDYPKFYKDNTSGKDLWHCRCVINEREIVRVSFAETEIDAVVELVMNLLDFSLLKNKK